MATDMYLKIADIPGESAAEKFKDQMEVLSYSWSVSQQKSGAPSTAGSLTSGRADFGDLSIVKAIDKASPLIAGACASGKHLGDATLTLCRAGEEQEPFMEYKLTDVLVTSYRPGGNGQRESLPLEEVSLAYGKIELKYTQTKVAGGKGSGNVAWGWDLKTNKKV